MSVFTTVFLVPHEWWIADYSVHCWNRASKLIGSRNLEDIFRQQVTIEALGFEKRERSIERRSVQVDSEDLSIKVAGFGAQLSQAVTGGKQEGRFTTGGIQDRGMRRPDGPGGKELGDRFRREEGTSSPLVSSDVRTESFLGALNRQGTLLSWPKLHGCNAWGQVIEQVFVQQSPR